MSQGEDFEDAEGAEDAESVGSVGDEAAKLFAALADAAREQGTGVGGGLAGLASYAAGALREVDRHVAAGDAECTWCPICRTVHAIRQTSPEVREHLASAASSLVQAAAGLLATAIPEEHRARGEGVERIDLDGADATTGGGTREDGSEDHWAEDE
jgi:hypothetical protein